MAHVAPYPTSVERSSLRGREQKQQLPVNLPYSLATLAGSSAKRFSAAVTSGVASRDGRKTPVSGLTLHACSTDHGHSLPLWSRLFVTLRRKT